MGEIFTGLVELLDFIVDVFLIEVQVIKIGEIDNYESINTIP